MTINSTTQSQIQSEIIDFKYYYRVLRQKKLLIALIGILAFSASFSWLYYRDDVYRSSTTILIKNEETQPLEFRDMYSQVKRSKEYLQTQFEILNSRSLVEKVVKKLGLTSHMQFEGDVAGIGTPDMAQAAVVDKVLSNLQVSPIRNTQLAKISYDSTNAKLTADVTNSLGEALVQSYFDARIEASKTAGSWLSERLGVLREKLRESEEKLQAYKEDEGLVDISGVQTLEGEVLENLNERYVDAQNKRVMSENLNKIILSYGRKPSVQRLLLIPEIGNHVTIQGLKKSEVDAWARLSELKKRYGPKHPKLVAAQTDFNSASSSLNSRVYELAEGISANYRMASEAEKSLEQQLIQEKKRFHTVDRKVFGLQELEREVAANKNLYELMLVRVKENQEVSGLPAVNARIIDRAVVPRIPIGPKRIPIALATTILAVFFVAAVILLRNALINRLQTPEDAEVKLGTQVLGFLPLVKSNRSELAYQGFINDKTGMFAEAMRTLRTSVSLANLNSANKVIVVTSTLPNEGKSTVSLNLAVAMGQTSRVLLIDTDIRRPTLGPTLGVKKTAPGLINLVQGTHSLEKCLSISEHLNIDYITVGSSRRSPYKSMSGQENILETLAMAKFREIISELSKGYDHVILDSSPVFGVSDSLILSTMADSIVYVVKVNSTPINAVKTGLKSLAHAQAPLAGVVLNMVDVEKVISYEEFYGNYYQAYVSNDASYGNEKQLGKLS